MESDRTRILESHSYASSTGYLQSDWEFATDTLTDEALTFESRPPAQNDHKDRRGDIIGSRKNGLDLGTVQPCPTDPSGLR